MEALIHHLGSSEAVINCLRFAHTSVFSVTDFHIAVAPWTVKYLRKPNLVVPDHKKTPHISEVMIKRFKIANKIPGP